MTFKISYTCIIELAYKHIETSTVDQWSAVLVGCVVVHLPASPSYISPAFAVGGALKPVKDAFMG